MPDTAAGLDKPAVDTGTVSDGEQQRETEDMTEVLERLNLSAVNNRVFSVSDETQELLRKFKLIFKDLINGVPTAYHDLESLLTNGNKQLQQTYSQLPSFLQKLIERLPDKWTETLAPEILAAAAERAGKSGMNAENAGKAAAAAKKMGVKVPSLKELVGKPTAIVGMLRSIMAFLRARFPAVMGMNVLWSIALFSKCRIPELSIYCTMKPPSTGANCFDSSSVRAVVLPQAGTGSAARERAHSDRGGNQEDERAEPRGPNPGH